MTLDSNREQRAAAHTLANKDFEFICKLVYDSTGIVLDERKREMVYRRLMRRTRTLKIPTFTEYCQLLKNNTAGELNNFINAITTNLTSFFRESHHFDFLRDVYLPQLIQQQRRAADDQKIRIWSSACSTGEEAYSAAITLHEVLGNSLASWDAKILATDLDSDVVAIGKKGIYVHDRIKDLDLAVKKQWFHNGSGDNEGNVRVDRRLADLTTFKQLNLLHEWPMRGLFDVIFCRNVMIYFDKQTQAKLLPRFYDQLKTGGILFLGHSESITKNTTQFESIGKTIFRKPASH